MQHSLTVLKSLKLILHPITPIHVWSGQKLVVGIDIVKKHMETLCIVDEARIPQELINTLLTARVEDMPKIIESYSDRIPCKQELKAVITLSPYVSVLELNPYIVPGSTLKGYIRTATLFAFIREIGDANKVVNILKAGVNLGGNPKQVAEGLEASFFRKPKPKKQRGAVDSFQSLLVLDPELNVELDCYNVSEIHVYELQKKMLKRIASQYAITVNCGELKYHINLVAPVNEILLAISRTAIEHRDVVDKLRLLVDRDILKTLKMFGCYLLSKEIEKVKNVAELSNYAKLLSDLNAKYCEKDIDCTIARIGYMTGLLSKTVIGVIKEFDAQLYNDIKNFMTSHIHHTWDELTIKLVKTSQGLVGPGWCEICPG